MFGKSWKVKLVSWEILGSVAETESVVSTLVFEQRKVRDATQVTYTEKKCEYNS